MEKAACKRDILHERILRAYRGPVPVAGLTNRTCGLTDPGISVSAAKPLLAMARCPVADN